MKDQLEKIIAEFSNDGIVTVNEIKDKGLVNRIYVVETTSDKYVVRIDPDESTTNRFNKEVWCMNQALSLGIPSPRPLRVGITKGHPYILASYVDGINGEDYKDSSLIWDKLGTYVRKIHSIEVRGFGEDMISDGEFDGNFEKFLGYNISSLAPDDALLKKKIITEDQQKTLKDVFNSLKKTDLAFGLVHHDFSLNNTIVSESGEVYLLDWGSARVDVVPHTDIAEILNSSLDKDSAEFRLFLESYALPYEEFSSIENDMEKLDLLSRTDKVRWAIDRRPDRLEAHSKRLLEKLKAF